MNPKQKMPTMARIRAVFASLAASRGLLREHVRRVHRVARLRRRRRHKRIIWRHLGQGSVLLGIK